MTTIAYKNGVLAVDTLSCYGNTRESDNARKVICGKDGTLYAMCGDFGVLNSYATSLSKGELPQPLPKDVGRVLQIKRHGDVMVHESGGAYPLKAREFAYGSGSDMARGAMAAGADAARAVRIAAKLDVNTGGRVITYKVKK